MKKIVLFTNSLTSVGGGERLALEEEKYFCSKGNRTYILTYEFNKRVLFDGTYKPRVVKVMNKKTNSGNILITTIFRILSLRAKIREIKPDIIIAQSAWECIYLYFATLFTPYFYVVHIHGTIFWFNNNLLKYAFIHRSVFNEIRNSIVGHREFIPIKPPKTNLAKRIATELIAVAMYLGVRKAKRIFVLSNHMRWEVSKLYGKDAIVLQGAFPRRIFSYKSKKNIKQKLGLKNKRIILTINRLDPRKRTGLLIRAFKQMGKKWKNVILVIGGVGPDEERLKRMVKDLNIENKVKFVGYVEEHELWDYYSCCDVFAHLNWADFAIAPFEALALGKKVVWTSEMDVDESFIKSKRIFITDPEEKKVAQALERALATRVIKESKLYNLLRKYTWDQYFQRIKKICFSL